MRNIAEGIVGRLGATLASKTGSLPSVAIHDYRMVGEKVGMVTVSHTHDGGKDDNYQALASLLDGRARPVPGSFRRINDRDEHRVVSVGFVVSSPLIEELTTERQTAMTVIAKNVLMDNIDNSLWDVKQTAGGATFIARQGDEELGELLHTLRQPKVGVTAAADIGSCTPNRSDFVGYVDLATDEVSHGYVVASKDADTSYILPTRSDTLVEVANVLIVGSAQNIDTDQGYLEKHVAKAVTAGIKDPDKLKEYYRKVYSYDPAYLELVERTIDKQASL